MTRYIANPFIECLCDPMLVTNAFCRPQLGATGTRIAFNFLSSWHQRFGGQKANSCFMATDTHRNARGAETICRLTAHELFHHSVFQRMKRDNHHSAPSLQHVHDLWKCCLQTLQLAVDCNTQRLKYFRCRVDRPRLVWHPCGNQCCQLCCARNGSLCSFLYATSR